MRADALTWEVAPTEHNVSDAPIVPYVMRNSSPGGRFSDSPIHIPRCSK